MCGGVGVKGKEGIWGGVSACGRRERGSGGGGKGDTHVGLAEDKI